MPRKATVTRKTKETDIKVSLNLDGKGDYKVDTSIPFADHMLSLMSRHGHIDINVKAKGDIEIDYHHTIEDLGNSGCGFATHATGPVEQCFSKLGLSKSRQPAAERGLQTCLSRRFESPRPAA